MEIEVPYGMVDLRMIQIGSKGERRKRERHGPGGKKNPKVFSPRGSPKRWTGAYAIEDVRTK